MKLIKVVDDFVYKYNVKSYPIGNCLCADVCSGSFLLFLLLNGLHCGNIHFYIYFYTIASRV